MLTNTDSNYLWRLEEIKQDCLELLPYGSPEWPKFKTNRDTLTHFLLLRKRAQVEIDNIQIDYMNKLFYSGIPHNKIDDTIKQDDHQFELRKQYALLSVKLIQQYGVAVCHEMTQLAMIKIKERFPRLTVQFATLKYYNHGFVIVNLPNEKMVFDLFAFGFGNPVIFPLDTLEKNMSMLKLEPLTLNDITPLNEKYLQVWNGKGDAPLNAYSVRLEIKSDALSKQASSQTYSPSSLCMKLGVFAMMAAASVAAYYVTPSFTR